MNNVRTAIIDWASQLNRPVTVAEIKQKCQQLLANKFNEEDFMENMAVVAHFDYDQDVCDSGYYCRPIDDDSRYLYLNWQPIFPTPHNFMEWRFTVEK